MEYKCPKCDALLSSINNKFVCDYCKSEYDFDYFNSEKTYEYILPFELDKTKAVQIYKKNIKSKILTPKPFIKVNDIREFYIPCYLYSLICTGEVEYEGIKSSFWKSNGIKYKKSDTYKITRGGEIVIKDMLIPVATTIESRLINSIEPYDFSKLIKIDKEKQIDCKIYDFDMTKERVLDSLKSKAKLVFIEEFKRKIKDYEELKETNDFVNLHSPKKKLILVPIYLLNIEYKMKNYTYIINGQNGNFYGDIPVNKKRILIIFICIFATIFLLLFILSLAEVIIW